MSQEELEKLIKEKLSVNVHVSTHGTVSVELRWDGVPFDESTDYITFHEPD